MQRIKDAGVCISRGLKHLRHMRNALIGFSNALYAIPYFSTLGNEIVIRINHNKSGEVLLISHCHGPSNLAKRERKGLDTGIEEFDLKGRVFDRAFLAD